MSNTAQDIIVPPPRVFRIVFLYVGQGESTLLVVPNGNGHDYVLVDSHQDDSFGGLDLVRLFKDLFKGKGHGLHVYINTHPHKDHVGGVKKLYDAVGIAKVWHSDHKPGKDHEEAYKELEYVMKRLGKDNVFVLKGSREDNKLDDKTVALGDITYNVLAPAEYVAEEIDDEDAEARYQRIHEQCGVLRFRYGAPERQVLITGDSDRQAWEKYIMYHRERLSSTVMNGSHHGSNTFFWPDSKAEGDPYKKHVEVISPSHVVISAPKRTESPHGHPDKEAMRLYMELVGPQNVYHLGQDRTCVIVDIRSDGGFSIKSDGALVETYRGSDDTSKTEHEEVAVGPTIIKSPSKPWCP